MADLEQLDKLLVGQTDTKFSFLNIKVGQLIVITRQLENDVCKT